MRALRLGLCLAVTVTIMAGCAQPGGDADTWSPPAEAKAMAQVRFQEVGADRGLAGLVGDPDAGGRLPEGMSRMGTMAGGVSVADVDGDGRMDLLVLDDHGAQLYLQGADGRFVEKTRAWGLAGTFDARIGLWWDMDDDGDQDLFLGLLREPSRLFMNTGTTLEEVTGAADMHVDSSVHAAAAGDVDGDGDLDLLVGNYQSWWEAEGAGSIQDEVYQSATRPQRNMLWRNNGDGTFDDVAASSGLDLEHSTLGVAMADLDRDGDLDIMTSNDFAEQDRLYLNDGSGSFTEAAAQRGVPEGGDGMGVTWADFDGDGWLDAYVSNIEDPAPSAETAHRIGNFLLWNDGDGTFTDATWETEARQALWSWGGAAFDVENDGDVDLFVPNGFHGDEAGPDQPNRFFLNVGDGRFARAGPAVGLADPVNGRGVAQFDMDDDGDIDLVHAAYGAPPLVYENTGPTGHFLQVALEGRESGRDAVGAVVYVEAEGQTQVRQRQAGGGYLSQSWPVLHFGLDASDHVDVLHIAWPSGLEQTFHDVEAGGRIHIVEGEAPRRV